MWLFSSLAIDSLAIAGQVSVAVYKGKGDTATAREVSCNRQSQQKDISQKKCQTAFVTCVLCMQARAT